MENNNLIEQLKSLEGTIEKTNSFKAVFIRGVITGVGTFVGATVVAAIVIAILVQALGLLGINLGIGEYLQSLIQK